MRVGVGRAHDQGPQRHLLTTMVSRRRRILCARSRYAARFTGGSPYGLLGT